MNGGPPLRTQARHDRVCWACTITGEHQARYYRHWRALSAFSAYEAVVEHIETLSTEDEFSIASLTQRLGPSPFLFGVVQHVIADLYLHGIIDCVQPARSGKRACYKYRLRGTRCT